MTEEDATLITGLHRYLKFWWDGKVILTVWCNHIAQCLVETLTNETSSIPRKTESVIKDLDNTEILHTKPLLLLQGSNLKDSSRNRLYSLET